MDKDSVIDLLNDLIQEIKEKQKPVHVLVDLYAYGIVSEFRKNRNEGFW